MIQVIHKNNSPLILQDVSVFEGVATCSYGENQQFKKSVKLEGIGIMVTIIINVYIHVNREIPSFGSISRREILCYHSTLLVIW